MPAYFNSEIIRLGVASILGGFNEEIVVSAQLSYNLTGGSFSINILKGSAGLLSPNSVLGLPGGRIGTVKSVGSNLASGGLLDVVAGVILPFAATLVNSYNQIDLKTPVSLQQVAGQLGASWRVSDFKLKNFSFRGNVLAGIQQVAAVVLADVIVTNAGILVTVPGQEIGSFGVDKTDLVSLSQVLDFSLDVRSALNPASTPVPSITFDLSDFVYDAEHAQKQPKFTVQAGAPGAQGSTDFIPIPDGWLIDGSFEDWTPSDPATDRTNPDATPTNGRYWKVFPSPNNPSQLRGITDFSRLVKQLNLPPNVSTFVGSPITELAHSNLGGVSNFQFNSPGTQSGIYGFNAEDVTMFDAISGQFLELKNCLVLRPGGVVDNGFAASNFYTMVMEMWTFPKVSPQVFPVGPVPTNPFAIPNNVILVTPNTGVVENISSYNSYYLQNFKRINSPRSRTQATVIYRGTVPQIGNQLVVGGAPNPNCGRITAISLNLGRSGITMSITAERYQAAGGLWSG